MEKWINYIFEDDEDRTKADFSRFSNDIKMEIEKQIQGCEYEIKGFSKGYFFVSGFVHNPRNNRYAYFYVGDVRNTGLWHKKILVRESKSLKDHTGGINRFISLSEMGSMLRNILERPISEFGR